MGTYKKIKKKIYQTLKNSSAGRVLLRMNKVRKGRFRRELKKELQALSGVKDLDLNKFAKDVKRDYIKYGVTPGEYLDFKFSEKSKAEKSTYFSIFEIPTIYTRTNKHYLPMDKYEKYRVFSDFFHRDVIRIDGLEDHEKYARFLENNERIIVKPIVGEKGQDVQIFDSDEVKTIEALKERTKLPVLIEQVLHQGKELAAFHPSSINTIRIVTLIDRNDEFSVLFSLLRTGQGGSTVDNVGAGGLACLIDSGTGMVISDALHAHKYYKVHPDTGQEFVNTKIPDWDQLLSTVKKAHQSFSKQKLIGWDFAWTEHGWDMVEANAAPSFASYQAITGKGVKPMLQELGLI